ncbi:Cuticle Protein CPR RR Unclassified 12 [Frankliniella occidentalis]|nr:Cuticle Protein CPR RR Unclassified 12 [Frankliniella occidentalis]
MRVQVAVALLALLAATEARRVRVQRVRPAADLGDEELVDQDGVPQQVQYYAAPDDRADTRSGRVVLLPAADALNGLSPSTIRNYSKVNDDGSFTFGYEAADGSFKEETRGTDCVVRGKYGYVDPDGNKREFTYVSGNPCDPNAVQDEEPQPGGPKEVDDSGEENIPANFPSRSLRPTAAHTRPARPTTTLFQQSYNQDSEEDIDDDDLPAAPVPVRQRTRPTAAPTPSPARARLIVTTPRPTTALYQSTATATTPQPAVRITPRPYSSSTTAEPPATTYRPLASPQPAQPYSPVAAPIRSSTPGTIDFSEELRKFQLDNNVVATSERPGSAAGHKGSEPIYSTELVFDPASGQYNTVVYQSLPKSQPQDISAVQRHRLQPYVAQQQLPQHLPQHLQQQPQHLQQQQPQPGNVYQQQLVQQQQATLLQQSQQLFAQQQRQLQQQRSLAQAQASYQAPRYQPTQLQQPVQYAAAPGHSSAPQTQFYYVSPQDAGDQRAALAAGQIDAFLRGHNLSF